MWMSCLLVIYCWRGHVLSKYKRVNRTQVAGVVRLALGDIAGGARDGLFVSFGVVAFAPDGLCGRRGELVEGFQSRCHCRI
jgi:hypothetical protein